MAEPSPGLSIEADAQRWSALRRLFDAVCDLPRAQWRGALQQLSDDAALVDEVLALLDAQTVSFDRALTPLHQLMETWTGDEPRVGDRLGVWQLVQRLASGGMGTVFVAERADGLFRQRVAIKLLHVAVAAPVAAQRLAEERQILAELQHPNIAHLFDGGTTPTGQPYLVMEYVEGPPLDQHCIDRGLSLDERLRMFLRVCRAVQAAHQRLVVHCDLKPSNILVRDGVAPVLLDFGIARLLGEGASADSLAFCTPAYASPEQLAGERVTVASDVFSLGVLFTELLAARAVGRGAHDSTRTVVLPSTLAGAECAWRRKLRGDLDAIAARACALQPEQRYASVEGLMRDIEAYLDRHIVSARPPTVRYQLTQWCRRNWRLAGTAVVGALLLGGFIWQLREARARAEQEAAAAQQVSDFLVAAFDAADPRMRGDRGAIEPTARDVLDLGAARIDTELAASPAHLARMRAVLGRAYTNLGLPQPAGRLLDQAAAGYLAPDVDQPERAAQVLIDRASLLAIQQDGAQAEAPARRALALLGSNGAMRDRMVAHTVLGYALSQQGDLRGAEREYGHARELIRALGPELPVRDRLHAMRAFADLHRRRGEIEPALQAYREALVASRALGKVNVELQVSLHGLGMALLHDGRIREVYPILAEHLDVSRALYGMDSLAVGDAYMDLASVLREQGEYRRAAALLQQALAVQLRTAGAHSREYTLIVEHLGHLAHARGDDVQAEREWTRSIADTDPPLGTSDRRRLRTLMSVAVSRACRGGADTTVTVVDDLLAQWRRHHADDRMGSMAMQFAHIEWLACSGRIEAAAALLAALPASQVDPHPILRFHRARLQAELSQRRRQWPEASRWWRSVIAMSAAESGVDSAATARWRVQLAEVLFHIGVEPEACIQLARASAPLHRELAPKAVMLRRLDILQKRLLNSCRASH